MLSESQRALQDQQDAALLPMPLSMNIDGRIVAAHLRRIVRLLQGDGASPCHDAVTYVTYLFERSVTPRNLACGKGCAHCCVQTVVVTAAEAFAVAAETQAQNMPVAAEGKSRWLGENREGWRKCDFLRDDGGCGVYVARPLACHAFVSLDLQACIDFFAGGTTTPSFTPNDRQQMLYACRMMLYAAHSLTGHGTKPGVELTSAVATILRTPDAEARWLKGEDVLKDLAVGSPAPLAVAQEIARMVALVAPTL